MGPNDHHQQQLSGSPDRLPPTSNTLDNGATERRFNQDMQIQQNAQRLGSTNLPSYPFHFEHRRPEHLPNPHSPFLSAAPQLPQSQGTGYMGLPVANNLQSNVFNQRSQTPHQSPYGPSEDGISAYASFREIYGNSPSNIVNGSNMGANQNPAGHNSRQAVPDADLSTGQRNASPSSQATLVQSPMSSARTISPQVSNAYNGHHNGMSMGAGQSPAQRNSSASLQGPAQNQRYSLQMNSRQAASMQSSMECKVSPGLRRENPAPAPVLKHPAARRLFAGQGQVGNNATSQMLAYQSSPHNVVQGANFMLPNSAQHGPASNNRYQDHTPAPFMNAPTRGSQHNVTNNETAPGLQPSTATNQSAGSAKGQSSCSPPTSNNQQKRLSQSSLIDRSKLSETAQHLSAEVGQMPISQARSLPTGVSNNQQVTPKPQSFVSAPQNTGTASNFARSSVTYPTQHDQSQIATNAAGLPQSIGNTYLNPTRTTSLVSDILRRQKRGYEASMEDTHSLKRQTTNTTVNPYLSQGYQPATATTADTYSAAGQFRPAHATTANTNSAQGQGLSDTERNRLETERLVEEERLEQERRVLRKAELRKDPNVLYRHYHEYIEYFPLEPGQRKDPYLSSLLAGRAMPSDPDSEEGLAVAYAREHWEDYMEYPRDVKRAAGYMRETPQYQAKLALEQAKKDWKPKN
ncbi:hypothetical protein IQ07DRAFT_120628 [Pyrenochaeta sp. DS3sAY3a]|nr:hypothetical protein IQ07DRAFT_120628 [Pyrenochaeta sp. DS3sAY3a]